MKKMSVGVKSIIVLTVICLVVAALLAVTDHITAPIIKTMSENRIASSLANVLPDSGEPKEILLEGDQWPDTVKKLYSFEDGSYAVVLATVSEYSNGDMGITVGIGPDSKILGIMLTSYYESKDFGKATYPINFIGKDEQGAAEVDTFTGVTYSSTAFKEALSDAFKAVELAKTQGGAAQ